MTKIRIQSLLAALIICGSAQAQQKNETQTSRFIKSIKKTVDSVKDNVGAALALSAIGGITFYEDHLKPLQEGEYPEAGDSRILWSAQYNKDEAFAEGRFQGGSVLGAYHKCLAAKTHYEDPKIYGPGACERVLKYAPGHHLWESLKSTSKWYFFVIPVGVTTAVIASCTGVCAYKKIKRH